MVILPSMEDSGVLEEKALEPVRRRQPEEVAATAVAAHGPTGVTVPEAEDAAVEIPTKVVGLQATPGAAAVLLEARAKSVVMAVRVQ